MLLDDSVGIDQMQAVRQVARQTGVSVLFSQRLSS